MAQVRAYPGMAGGVDVLPGWGRGALEWSGLARFAKAVAELFDPLVAQYRRDGGRHGMQNLSAPPGVPAWQWRRHGAFLLAARHQAVSRQEGVQARPQPQLPAVARSAMPAAFDVSGTQSLPVWATALADMDFIVAEDYGRFAWHAEGMDVNRAA